MAEHAPAVAHQFEDPQQQRAAGELGMWLFLVTEFMFFGGLFLAYLVYRRWYPAEFAAGSRTMDLLLGTLNTAILLTSSLTMALAVQAAQQGRPPQPDRPLAGHADVRGGLSGDQRLRIPPQIHRAADSLRRP